MKRGRRMGLHPRHDLSNSTRRCVEATIRQGLSRITAPAAVGEMRQEVKALRGFVGLSDSGQCARHHCHQERN